MSIRIKNKIKPLTFFRYCAMILGLYSYNKALLPIMGGVGDMTPILPIMGVGDKQQKHKDC